ncbi:MAG TPA: hypothetical protein VL947_01170 [Cytophagales bacterium]|nr:hypothetical protein [Cytophagales bacterium]
MKILFLILVQLLFGWGVLNKFKYGPNLALKLSLSYLIGIFGSSLCIYVLEFAHVKLTYTTVIIANVACSMLINLDFKRFKESLKLFVTIKTTRLSLFDLISIGVIGYYLYYSVWRMYHLPVVPFDALVGIDLLAKAAVEEGHVVSSIFTRPDIKSHLSTQPFYAPLTAFNQITYRLAGAPFGQVWIPLATIAFSCFAYVRLKELTHATVAGIAVILLFCSTELYAYTYLLQTDLSNAIFFSIGLLFMVDFLKDKSNMPIFGLSALFMTIAVWTRIETVLVTGFCALLIVWEYIKDKDYKKMVYMPALYMAAPLVANIMWNGLFYNFVFPFHPETKSEIIWAGKYSSEFTPRIWDEMTTYLFSTDYWGYLLYIYLILVLINIIVYRDKTSVYTLVLILLFNVAFFFMLHHFDKVIVQATYRRGLFKLLMMVVLFFGELRLLQSFGARLKSWVTNKD